MRLGETVFDLEDDDSRPVTIKIDAAIAHPDYNRSLIYNDISLLRLVDSIEFNAYVRPACLNTLFTFQDERAITTGWGRIGIWEPQSQTLLKVVLDLFQFNECAPFYSGMRKVKQGILDDQQMCAASREDEKDACEGDSGGPLQVYHSKYCMYKVLGITSFGKFCGNPGTPSVFTRVSKYVDWIEATAFEFG